MLQGSPLSRTALEKGVRPFPQAKALRAFHLAGYVPGNHDFNFGKEILAEFLKETGAVTLAANLEGAIPSEKWHVWKMDDGLSVGIVGVLTDYVNVWEQKENLKGIAVTDCVLAARKAYAELKGKRDYTVCVYHGGYDDPLMEGRLRENRAEELSRIGFDVLLTSHQHIVRQPFFLQGTITLQAQGRNYTLLDFHKDRHLVTAEVLSSGEGERYPHEEGERAERELLPFQEETLRELKKVLGHTVVPFADRGKLESAMHGSALADFLNQVQIEATGADISAVSLFNEPRTLGSVVTLGNLISCYPFANTLVKIEVNGKTLKEALERDASYFDLDRKGNIVISDRFLIPKVEHYNYDYYQNLRYRFSIGNPLGHRVTELSWKGHDLLKESGTILSLAVNNYRYSGTGGYGMYHRSTVLGEIGEDMQELLIKKLKGATVPLPPKGDFSVTK